MIRIRANKETIDNERIIEFEIKNNFKLPKDFFDFLIKNNGGKPDINIVNVDNFGQININNFFGINLKKNENDLEYCYSKYKNRIPVGCLPIADAEGGNIICISLSKDFGSIYFWDHEMEANEGEEPNFSNMYKISNSFTIFLNKIEKFDPSSVEINEKDVVKVWVDPDFLKEINK